MGKLVGYSLSNEMRAPEPHHHLVKASYTDRIANSQKNHR
jgi:hypothetical protein